MKSYLIFTDINSRQYPIQIPEEGYVIISETYTDIEVLPDDPKLNQIMELAGKIMINNQYVFDLDHIVAIQYQQIPDDAF